jgi:hypothetical protein
MKGIFLSLLSLIFISQLSSYAQQHEIYPQKGQIGITFSSFGDNDVIRSSELIGSGSCNGDGFYTLGISYLYKLKKYLDLETGIECSNHKIIITPAPGIDLQPYSTSLTLIYIPVGLRLNFLKYCFINGGLGLDIDTSDESHVNDQSGIGANLGLGLKYDFKFRVSAFINPYLKGYSVIPFSSDNYHQRLMETGFRFGLLYNLKKNPDKQIKM